MTNFQKLFCFLFQKNDTVWYQEISSFKFVHTYSFLWGITFRLITIWSNLENSHTYDSLMMKILTCLHQLFCDFQGKCQYCTTMTLCSVYFMYIYWLLWETTFWSSSIQSNLENSHTYDSLMMKILTSLHQLFCDFQEKASVLYQDKIALCLFYVGVLITMRKNFLIINNMVKVKNSHTCDN